MIVLIRESRAEIYRVTRKRVIIGRHHRYRLRNITNLLYLPLSFHDMSRFPVRLTSLNIIHIQRVIVTGLCPDHDIVKILIKINIR